MEQKSYLLLGVGGMGMAPLAIYLAEQGHEVYGWDDGLAERVRHHLETAKVVLLVLPEFPQNIDEVIFSTAIHEEHPLYQKALERQLPLTRRGVFWARMVEEKKLIAIIGSNGKTTTTGTFIHILREQGIPCSYLLGGLFCDSQVAPAHHDASSEWVVSEIDESDRTMDHFSPEMTLVLNIGSDHIVNYGSVEAIQHSFQELFRRTRRCVFFPKEDALLRRLAEESGREHCPCECEHLPYSREFQALFQGFRRIDYNLIAEAFRHMTGDFPALEAFSHFPGIFQRNNFLATIEKHLFFCDHAHHPNEIRASLEHFRHRYPAHRLGVIFRPHRFSRVQQYAREFAEALRLAERICFVPTDPSDESFNPEGTCERIAEHLPPSLARETVSAIPAIPDAIEPWLWPADGAFCCVYLSVGPSTFLDSLPEIQARALEKKSKANTKLQTMSVRENEPMAHRTSFRIGGPARFWAEPQNEEQLREILLLARDYSLPVFVLGNGSNILCEDRGVPGLVLSLNQAVFRGFCLKEKNRVQVGAGMSLRALCHHLSSHSLGGIEALGAIPATVGGALAMNAGANGVVLSDYLLAIHRIDRDGRKSWIPKNEINWQYRRGFRRNGECILSALFEFPPVAPETSWALQKKFLRQRLEQQPRWPNAGSIFRNPGTGSPKAWELVDRCGLRGFRLGGAEISEQHANFIVNRGHASSEDVRRLIEHIRCQVFERFQLFLEREILQIPGDMLYS
ncbi:MAG: UDP-N-acetylmuramate dehydrogenase [Puniceicoccales bacterium]|jgi:UDP-N-acetylenolpyruvoylglucosamine reductase|nr:UDP-N-acetylmuramate dehydrogenase [Puniceicoccales bacterium]